MHFSIMQQSHEATSKEAVLCFCGFGECFSQGGLLETCTVVRTDSRLGESFEVKVSMHQGSVLSPQLFVVIMDVLSSETSSGLPSELLLMVPTMEQHGERRKV